MADVSDNDGKRVGSRQGDDILINDKVVARISGNTIKDLSGNVVGLIKGDSLVDAFGNQVFELRDNAVWDHLGDKIAAKAEDASALPAAAYYALLKAKKLR
jgi:hypothetical protein